MLCYWMCNILELLAAEWCWCSLNGCGEDDGDNIFFCCNTIRIQCLKAVTFVKGEESVVLDFFIYFIVEKKDFWKYMFIKKRTFNCGIVQWHDSATQRGSLKCNLTYTLSRKLWYKILKKLRNEAIERNFDKKDTSLQHIIIFYAVYFST